MATRRVLFAAVLVGCLAPAHRASADRADFKFDVSLAPFYNGGERIPYEVYLEITDIEGNGRDSQGLFSFVFDLVSNTGLSTGPAAFSRTRTTGPPTTTIRTPKWSLIPVPPYVENTSGFGFSGIGDPGNATSQPGNILGIGAAMPLTWDADIAHEVPGLQPHALHNVGYGTPPEARDLGGYPILDPRSKWYLAMAEAEAPTAPGTYQVELRTLTASFLPRDVDLNTGQGPWIPPEIPVFGDTFTFLVIPEPGSLAGVVLAATVVTALRRR